MVVANKDIEEQTTPQPAITDSTPEAVIPGVMPPPNKQFFVGKRKMDFSSKNSQFVLWGGAGLVVAVVLFLIIASHGPEGKKPPAPVKQNLAFKADPHKQGGLASPGDRAAQQIDTGENKDVLSAADLENTKNHTDNSTSNGVAALASVGQQSQSEATSNGVDRRSGSVLGQARQPNALMHRGDESHLGNIQPFRPAPFGTNPDNSSMSGEAMYQPTSAVQGGPEAVRELKEEVTKPSLVFTKQAATTSTGSSNGTGPEPITNVGLAPAFHISGHLESSASTIGGAPLVAVIEYDYTRNGQVLIPAGTRAVGKIQAASSTGLVNMNFSDLYFPSGTRVPISAVGLDDKLRLVKGKVTGKNTGKQLALAALTGVGTLGAGFVGGASNQAITEQQLAEMQMAQNTGRGVDQVVQQIDASQHIVVTVAAGIPIFVTFTAPPRTNTAGVVGGIKSGLQPFSAK